MEIFKYILVPFSVLLVPFIAACSSIAHTTAIKSDSGFVGTLYGNSSLGVLNPRRLLGMNMKIESVNQQGLKAGKSFSEEGHAKTIFATYCSGGKQIRTASITVTVEFPKPPRGTPLDNAVTLRNNFEHSAEEKIIELLMVQPSNNHLPSEMRTGTTTLRKPRFFAAPTGVSGLKSQAVRPNWLFFADPEKPSQLILLWAKNIQLYEGDLNVTSDNTLEITDHELVSPIYGSQERSWISSLRNTWFILHKYRDLLVMQEAVLFDAILLQNHYALVFPNKNMIMSHTGWSPMALSPHKFYDEQGQPVPSTFISQRKMMWRGVIKTASKLQRTQSGKGGFLYRVELDLSDLCKFGRHIADLSSI